MTQAPEVTAYYEGKNAAWFAIADGKNKVQNPYNDSKMRASFYRGARHAFAEERLDMDTEWDGDE